MKKGDIEKKVKKDKEKTDAELLEDEEEEVIEVGETIIVRDLAEKLDLNPSELITKLIGLGVMASQNQSIDAETAALVAEEFGATVVINSDEEEIEEDIFDLDLKIDLKT